MNEGIRERLEALSDFPYHLSPITYHLSPITHHPSPITYHLSPITYHLSPITHHLSPITYHIPPITYHLPPTTYHISPITYHLSPIIHHPSPITHHPSPITHHLSHVLSNMSSTNIHGAYNIKRRTGRRLLASEILRNLTYDFKARIKLTESTYRLHTVIQSAVTDDDGMTDLGVSTAVAYSSDVLTSSGRTTRGSFGSFADIGSRGSMSATHSDREPAGQEVSAELVQSPCTRNGNMADNFSISSLPSLTLTRSISLYFL